AALHYTGSDSFTYTTSDGIATSNTATVTITVTDQAPSAAADSYGVHANTTLNGGPVGVLLNDSDPDNDSLSAVLVSGVTHGTLTLNADGSFTYVPAHNYTGSDSFNYQASDGVLTSNTATVSLTVSNSTPVANDDSYGTPSNTTLTVSAANGLLDNDTDPDNDVLTATLITGPAPGTLTLHPD